MNTRFELIFWDIDQKKSTVVLNEIKEKIYQIELLLSSYDPHSEVYKINKSATINSYEISPELYDTIILCESYKRKTLSYFDYLFDESSVYKNAPKKYSKKSSYGEKIVLDKQQKKITFTGMNYCFDFGAIGKGIAIQEVSDILLKNNILNAFISFGESSILTRGKHPHGSYWSFTLVNMQDNKEQLATLKLNDHFISTSATLQNTENQEKKYHIINPKTGEYIKIPKMICVKSDSPVEAEVLSTALLITNDTEQENILNNFKNYEIIEVSYNRENKPNIRKFYDREQ